MPGIWDYLNAIAMQQVSNMAQTFGKTATSVCLF